MNEKYQVSVSPHVRDSISTRKIMLFVIIALLPASIVGVLNFGPYALLIFCLSVASSVAAEESDAVRAAEALATATASPAPDELAKA